MSEYFCEECAMARACGVSRVVWWLCGLGVVLLRVVFWMGV